MTSLFNNKTATCCDRIVRDEIREPGKIQFLLTFFNVAAMRSTTDDGAAAAQAEETAGPRQRALTVCRHGHAEGLQQRLS